MVSQRIPTPRPDCAVRRVRRNGTLTQTLHVAGKAPAVAADRQMEEAEMEAELIQGMHALILGALAMVEQNMAGCD